MPSPSIEVSLIIFVILMAIGIAGFFASSRPYNIFAESWRQAGMTIIRQPVLFLAAWLIFAVQELVPPMSFLVAWPSGLVQVGLLIAFHAMTTYLLARIALRLHRGLIHDEWRPVFPTGGRARRMGFYVLVCWAVIGLLKHPPLPGAPVAHEQLVRGAILLSYALGFMATAGLALVGPAASLDERRPIRTSLRTALREPITLLVIIIGISLQIGLVMEAANLALSRYPQIGGFRLLAAPVVWAFMALVLFMSEFALVIFLTRVWEDRYEEDTRNAAHNFNWT
ncbi:hypothetical protein C5L14_01135 [Labrys okinawensis]|uniref:Uncharacterized protein n=1 Tax=Labrys okinawensis TaxID=346911 RepID=A0A2S9QIQ8_9HYPH|nr:hypothetical protein [Labrys okinawensis]PRH89228.1 hypothetical protein C5L14_01135 [Labrys okinawensis]